MDLSFARDSRWRAAAPARIDYQRLVASLSAAQAASATARTESLLAARSPHPASPVDALAALLAGGAGWARAMRGLGGSFHPGAAARLASPWQER